MQFEPPTFTSDVPQEYPKEYPTNAGLMARPFGYGGVNFELLGEPNLAGLKVHGAQEQFISFESNLPTIAHATCTLWPQPSLAAAPANFRDIHCEWNRDEANISTVYTRAHVRRMQPGWYVASAHIQPDENGIGSLLTSVAGALVLREHGLILHAAGVEVEGGAVLFIGPSGAGKTTSSNHVMGARWFCYDRAALVFSKGQWMVWALPGGDEVSLEASGKVVLPLLGILRVHKDPTRTRIQDGENWQKLFWLRESLQAAGVGAPTEEAHSLEASAQLLQSVPIAGLHAHKGDNLFFTLKHWLDL